MVDLTSALARLEINSDRLWADTDSTDEIRVHSSAADFLAALYPVTRHGRDQLGKAEYYESCRSSDAGRTVAGLTWLRGQHDHHLVELSDYADTFARYLHNHYGCWTWKAGLEGPDSEIHTFYASHVAGREIRPTLLMSAEFIRSHTLG